jgi:hypothetical protein
MFGINCCDRVGITFQRPSNSQFFGIGMSGDHV